MTQSIFSWKGKPVLLLPSNNMSVFLLWYIGNGFRGIFFPINQLDCSEVHVQGMNTSVNPSRTGFSIAVCASAYVKLVAVATSALLFHSGSRTCHIDSHWFCSAQCNRWHLVCVVSSRGCDDTVKFGVLSVVMPVVSVSDLWVIHIELAEVWWKSVSAIHKDVECFVIFYNNILQFY